jgi:hypothetical protein
MAAACPWVFARLRQPELHVDFAEVWRKLCDYVAEDFAPTAALIRLKVIAPYFARNFFYGHSFFKAIHCAPDMATLRERAERFLCAQPALAQVSVDGI